MRPDRCGVPAIWQPGAVSGWRSGTSQNRMIQGYIRDCWGTERLTRASSSSGNPYVAVFFQLGLKRFALYVRDWETDQVRTLIELLEKLQTSMVTVSVRERPPASGRRWARENAQSENAVQPFHESRPKAVSTTRNPDPRVTCRCRAGRRRHFATDSLHNVRVVLRRRRMDFPLFSGTSNDLMGPAAEGRSADQ